MTTIISPVAVWDENPRADAAATLARMYWSYDAGTDTWTLTDDPALESGRFGDVTSTSTYTLTAVGAIPSPTPVLKFTRRNGADILGY